LFDPAPSLPSFPPLAAPLVSGALWLQATSIEESKTIERNIIKNFFISFSPF
jgi:hypothetical protein